MTTFTPNEVIVNDAYSMPTFHLVSHQQWSWTERPEKGGGEWPEEREREGEILEEPQAVCLSWERQQMAAAALRGGGGGGADRTGGGRCCIRMETSIEEG